MLVQPKMKGRPTLMTEADRCLHHKKQPRAQEAPHLTRKVEQNVPPWRWKARKTDEAEVEDAIAQRTLTEDIAKKMNVDPPSH